jgi:hypothetical protein
LSAARAVLKVEDRFADCSAYGSAELPNRSKRLWVKDRRLQRR